MALMTRITREGVPMEIPWNGTHLTLMMDAAVNEARPGFIIYDADGWAEYDRDEWAKIWRETPLARNGEQVLSEPFTGIVYNHGTRETSALTLFVGDKLEMWHGR